MKTFILTFTLLVTSAFATDVSFEGKTTFSPVTVQGHVLAFCGQRMASISCHSEFLEEGNFLRLTTSEAVDADRVVIVNRTNEREKSSKYKSKKKRTKKSFNLWVNTLTQRAFLENETNVIDYTFYKGEEEVLSGSFNADVIMGEVRNCPRANIRFQRGYCPTRDQVCDSYFNRFNYCR